MRIASRAGVFLVALMACTAVLARDLRVCADPNNLPFSNSAGEGFENRIVDLLEREPHLRAQMRGSDLAEGALSAIEQEDLPRTSNLESLLGGIAYVAVFSLANFVKYQPREIVVTIPPDKFLKNH